MKSKFQIRTLGEVVSITKGKKHNVVLDSAADGGERYIQIDDLRSNGNLKFTPEQGVEVQEQDVVIAWDGANAGTIGFGLHGFIGSTLARLKIERKDVLAEYLGWFLRSRSSLIREHCTGATVPHVNKIFLKSIRIPLPPLPIQKQIAAIFQKADAAREKRRQANKLTEQFLQSAFLEMFGDPLTNPKGWEKKPFAEVAEIERRSIESSKIDPDTNYLGLEHIEKESGKLLGFIPVRQAELKSNKFVFTREHLLYGKLRPYLNKVCLPGIDGVCSTDILPIRAKLGLSNRYFIAFLMKHKWFVGEANSHSSGANLPRISPSIIEKFQVYSPPISEQQKFAALVEKVEGLRGKQRESERELEELLQSLMQRAFRGELVS
jgi:type I restriction enzyme S subunit